MKLRTTANFKPLLLATSLTLALAFAVALLSPQTALAHATLLRAVPAPSVLLDAAPTRVQIWFTEPVAPAYSEIQVLDSAGVRVDKGDSAVDKADPSLMAVSLKPLEKGVYTVAWKNVSDVDGHKVVDSYVFSVGVPIAGEPSDADAKHSLIQYPLEPVVRWFVLLGAAGLLGGLAFDLAVADRVLARAGRSDAVQRARQALHTRRRRLLWIYLGLLLGASMVQLLFQAASASDVPPLKALGSPMASVLGNTQWGTLWLWRMACALALVGLVLWAYGRRGDTATSQASLPKLLAVAAMGGLLLTLSLASHGAAAPQIKGQAILSDYLHLLGASLWLGGLLHFATSIPLMTRGLSDADHRALVSAVVPRFSLLASLSISVVVITGLYSAWAQVTVLSALVTPYGGTLLVKVALIAPMLLLAAGNLLWVRPRLKAQGRAGVWLSRFVTGEAVLGLLVLGTVGFLTSLEPARQAVAASDSGGAPLQFMSTSEGVEITTTLTPGGVGLNDVLVALEDARGRPVDGAGVDVRLTLLGADLGEFTATAAAQGNGRYLWQGPLLSVAGVWQGDVTVRRTDAFDAHAAFRFELSPTGPSGSAVVTPNARTSQALLAVELGLIGVVFMIVGFSAGGMASRMGLTILSVGALVMVAGFGVGANLTSGSAAMPERNPFPPDEASLSVGSRIYVDQCQVCHGPFGHGDGPSAASLNPKPFDLVVHVPMHADRVLFSIISDGKPGTAMPGYKGKFTQDELWHIINFLRTFR